jgi:hypothetical protein
LLSVCAEAAAAAVGARAGAGCYCVVVVVDPIVDIKLLLPKTQRALLCTRLAQEAAHTRIAFRSLFLADGDEPIERKAKEM